LPALRLFEDVSIFTTFPITWDYGINTGGKCLYRCQAATLDPSPFYVTDAPENHPGHCGSGASDHNRIGLCRNTRAPAKSGSARPDTGPEAN
jgi:hypothetical protein